jgi:hypothetical protein
MLNHTDARRDLMAEETKETQEAPSGASSKNRKINKMTPDQVKGKVEDLEKGAHSKSIYYKHLLERIKQIQGS